MAKKFRELTITLDADQIEIIQNSLERSKRSMYRNLIFSIKHNLPTNHLKQGINRIEKLLPLFIKGYKF